jgi:hypothetical protein
LILNFLGLEIEGVEVEELKSEKKTKERGRFNVRRGGAATPAGQPPRR